MTHGAALRDSRFPRDEREDSDEEEWLEPLEGDLAFFFLSDRDGERPLSFPRSAGAAGDPC